MHALGVVCAAGSTAAAVRFIFRVRVFMFKLQLVRSEQSM